jgi:TonB-linked SusC/RagA family outer membrane protein
MQLTTFFLVVVGLQVSARTASQTITFSGENVPIVKVFREVKKQTGYLIAYNEELLKLSKPVTISVKNDPVENFMQRVLSGQPFEFAIEEHTIFIRRKAVVVNEPLSAPLPSMVVKGRVLTEAGDPLQGVTVSVKGSRTGTTTDGNGNFSLTVDKSVIILVFSYVGYLETELRIVNDNPVKVVLRTATRGLEEVVVVGYGTVKKADVTTSVVTVTSKQLENRPVMGALEAMAGQMAGVDIQQGNGQPGVPGMKVRIRGTNSISGSSDPLYVVDGVPMPDALSTVSVNDIENVTVLKDVSATAIYGSRGSSGVILITTKKAKSGAPVISVNSSVGMQQIARKIPMMGKEDYLELLIESKNNSWVDRDPAVNKATDDNATRQARGAAGSIKYIIPDGGSNPWGTFKYDIQNPADVAKMPDTDWQDEIYRNALITQNEVLVSGGTDNTRYVISGNYGKQDGIMINSTFQRFNVRAKVESKLRKNLIIGLQLMGNTGNGRRQAQGRNEALGGWGINLAALSLAPVFPVTNPDGSYADMQRNSDILGAGQPGFNAVELANNRYHYQKTYGWSAFGFAEWEIIPDLKYKLTVNGQLGDNENSFFEPKGVNDYGVTTTGTTSSNVRNKTKTTLIENLLNYNLTVAKKNNIALLGGYTIENAVFSSINTSANNAPTNYVQLVTGTPLIATTGASEYSLLSYLGRVMYNFDQRYMLTGTVRWDGSSRFSPGNKWGFFPSVSAGWKHS